MNKEDFSTTYVPLQPPYQIIKYGKDIGMQIGTMIASRHIEGDGDEAFHIETHSYPVVTYTNKNSVRGNRILFHYSFRLTHRFRNTQIIQKHSMYSKTKY